MSRDNVISFELARARRQAESEYDWDNIEALIDRASGDDTSLPDLAYLGELFAVLRRPNVPDRLRGRAAPLTALNELLSDVNGPPLDELARSIQKELDALLAFVRTRGLDA